MHRALRPLLLAVTMTAIAAPSFADPASDAFGACLVDKSTGRDRKDLARWMFVAMASHPEMQDLVALTPQSRDDITRKAAQVFVRLMTVDCLDEARKAFRSDTGGGFQGAGGKLGEVAIRELISDNHVTGAVSDISKYMDVPTVKRLLEQR